LKLYTPPGWSAILSIGKVHEVSVVLATDRMTYRKLNDLFH